MPSPENQASKSSLMERVGLAYFRRLSRKIVITEPTDEFHILNEDETKKLRIIQNRAVFKAFLAGAVSAACSAAAAFYADPILSSFGENPPLSAQIDFWLIVGGVSLIATFFELTFLYLDALRTVYQLSAGAGINLFRDGKENSLMLNALVRAALEMPSPQNNPFVDPHKEVSKWRVAAASAIYKAKVTATNFLAKAILRRLLGRVLARGIFEFVAIPLTAAWNAVVTWWIIREARIRVMGPSAVEALSKIIFSNVSTEKKNVLSQTNQLLLLRAVGSCIVRTQELHPNLFYLLENVIKVTGFKGQEPVDDAQLFLTDLGQADPEIQKTCLNLVMVGCIIDGKVTQREKSLVKDTFLACNIPFKEEKLPEMLTKFRKGREIDPEFLY